MGASQILLLLASIADKLLDRTPNYSQKKKEDIHKARMRYQNEINKEIFDRDDNLISVYHDELFYLLQDFDESFFKRRYRPCQDFEVKDAVGKFCFKYCIDHRFFSDECKKDGWEWDILDYNNPKDFYKIRNANFILEVEK